MLTTLKHVILGNPNKKQLKLYQPIIQKINALEASVSSLTDEELKQKTPEFKARLQKGTSLEKLLPEAFATVREVAKRTLNMRHFDVQLIGGIVLHEGKISEMKTGEGKTLVCTLPAYLNALEGKGVYVVTVNDYLARRDCEWMSTIYSFLGLSVGLIQNNLPPHERLQAYAADITYGTNNEFGFDYLRDNLADDLRQICQTRRHFAIIDEVDSILIDEARTPLIISGPIKDSTEKYKVVATATKRLNQPTHFTLDEKHKNVILTEEGIDKLEDVLKVTDIYSIENMDLAHMAVQCLKAKFLFKKDVDYVVKDGNVLIVDEFTGRILEGRRYSDGLHQAIEAVENLDIKEESQTLASVTFQNYFRMFPKLAGMTGTAATEDEEFRKIYNLPVVIVPTNKPLVRNDRSDIVYKTKQEKYNAIVKDIKEHHKKGQPVLVGTISIETSELLAIRLKREGIPHKVLNAKYHEQEAEIISSAGSVGHVTIATNMAGRGTDIVLGEGVVDNGGLYVIGSERHESRRIDNQLRGRSGRQGDPGASRFYVALDDDLMRLFGSDRIAKVMETLGVPDDTPIEHNLVTRSLEKAQKKVEQYYFGIRKQILQYDDVLNKQRESIYSIRRQILEKRDIDKRVKDAISEFITFKIKNWLQEKDLVTQKKDITAITSLSEEFTHICPTPNWTEKLEHETNQDTLIVAISNTMYQIYLDRKKELPPGLFEEVTKRILLGTLDRKWTDHLHNIDVLREGIGLRSFGNKDPLLEYKVEAFDMFSELLLLTWEEALEIINKVTIETGPPEEKAPKKTPVQAPEPSPFIYQSATTSPQKNSPPNSDSDQAPGRNERVIIAKDGVEQTLKWKKAEAMISNDGWQFVKKAI